MQIIFLIHGFRHGLCWGQSEMMTKVNMNTAQSSQQRNGRGSEFVGDSPVSVPIGGCEESSLVLRDLEVPANGEWAHRSGGWTFLLMRDGAASLDSATLSRPVKAGDALVLAGTAAATLHPVRPAAFFTYHSAVHPVSSAGFSCSCFRFFPDRLHEILNLSERHLLKTVERQLGGVMYHPAACKFAHCFQAIAKRQETSVDLAHRSQLLQLVSSWLTESTVASNGAETGEDMEDPLDMCTEARVAGVLRHMPHEQIQALSIDEVAQRCGCSRRHLNRVVNKHFGCSIVQLKLEVRLERATELLRNSNSKIIDVAMECGFNHLGAFSTKFRAKYGTTPAHWRGLATHDGASLAQSTNTHPRQTPCERGQPIAEVSPSFGSLPREIDS